MDPAFLKESTNYKLTAEEFECIINGHEWHYIRAIEIEGYPHVSYIITNPCLKDESSYNRVLRKCINCNIYYYHNNELNIDIYGSMYTHIKQCGTNCWIADCNIIGINSYDGKASVVINKKTLDIIQNTNA
jgi:hypothetical protein